MAFEYLRKLSDNTVIAVGSNILFEGKYGPAINIQNTLGDWVPVLGGYTVEIGKDTIISQNQIYIGNEYEAWDSPDPKPTPTLDCDVTPLWSETNPSISFVQNGPECTFTLAVDDQYYVGSERFEYWTKLEGTGTTSAPTGWKLIPIVGGRHICNPKVSSSGTIEPIWVKYVNCTQYNAGVGFLVPSHIVDGGGSGGGDGINQRVDFVEETALDTINWNQTSFQTYTVPSHINTVAGDGVKLFSADGTSKNLKDGFLALLRNGFSNILSNRTKSVYPNNTSYYYENGSDNRGHYFQALIYIATQAAYDINNAYGGNPPSSLGNISGMASYWSVGAHPDTMHWVTGITEEGWMTIGGVVGVYAQYVGGSNYSTYRTAHFDDETGVDEGGRYDGVRGILKGLTTQSTASRNLYYGMAPAGLINHQIGNVAYPLNPDGRADKSRFFPLTNTEIEEYVNSTGGLNLFVSSGKFWFDGSHGYFKHPFFVKSKKYAKNPDGSFILNASGLRRYYEDAAQTEVMFGANVTIKTVQDPYIVSQYSYKPIKGAQVHVDEVYRYVNALQGYYIKYTKAEMGVQDSYTCYPNRRIGLGSVVRPMIEPAVSESFYETSTEVGREGVEFAIMWALMSGVSHVELWDNNNAPESFVNFRNCSRWLAANAAINQFLKATNGSDPSTWRFVRWYYPIVGEKNRELLICGLYFGTKLLVFGNGHVLENGQTYESAEKCNVTIKAGASTFTQEFAGGHNVFVSFTVPSGLSASDFKLEYTNIYGNQIRVKGDCDSGISGHYY